MSSCASLPLGARQSIRGGERGRGAGGRSREPSSPSARVLGPGGNRSRPTPTNEEVRLSLSTHLCRDASRSVRRGSHPISSCLSFFFHVLSSFLCVWRSPVPPTNTISPLLPLPPPPLFLVWWLSRLVEIDRFVFSLSLYH